MSLKSASVISRIEAVYRYVCPQARVMPSAGHGRFADEATDFASGAAQSPRHRTMTRCRSMHLQMHFVLPSRLHYRFGAPSGDCPKPDELSRGPCDLTSTSAAPPASAQTHSGQRSGEKTQRRLAGAIQRVRSIVGKNAVLVTNSGAVAIATASAAILGFAYWCIAARLMAPVAIGISSALISAMGFIGQLGEGGIGTLLMGQMSVHGDQRHGLLTAANLTTLLSCFVLALICLGMASGLSHGQELFASGPWAPSLFFAGCIVTGSTLVMDHALVGLLLSRFFMYRNMIFSVTKLCMLVGFRWAFPQGDDTTIILFSWVFGVVTSTVLIVGLSIHRGAFLICPPKVRLLLSLWPSFLGHHLLNVLAQTPTLVVPMLVSVVVSPTANAAFYGAWMVLTVAFMIPGALTTILYTVGASNPSAMAERVRFSLLLSLAFAAIASIVFYIFATQILSIFSPAYPAMAASSLQLLGIGLFAGTIRYHYIAVVRVRGQMKKASVMLAISGIGEIAIASYGGWVQGLYGFTLGWTAALLVEAAGMLNTVVRAGWGRNNVRGFPT
jgi:O-antigen/teichoic acid export membrane protein